jgi:hypothetical protein
MKYALIENNIVKNIIVIDDIGSYPIMENNILIQGDNAKIGNKYNPETNNFEDGQQNSLSSTQVYTVPLIKISNQISTSSTLANDNDLQFSMFSDVSYYIEIFVAFSVAGLLPIYEWSLTGPDSPTSIVLRNQLILIGGTSLTVGTTSAYSTPVSTPSLTAGNGIIKVDGIIQNGANSGIFNFNFACTSGTSVTNLSGSYLRYTYGVSI